MKTRLMEIVQQSKYLSLDTIKQGITSSYVQDYAYILHDKDSREDGTLKAPHWHIYLRLKDSTDSKYIAQAFGVAEQYVNRVKGKWVDALMYCTHKNAPDKYQYNDDDVVSNFDFVGLIAKTKAKKSSDARLAEIIDSIDAGIIREYNYTQYITMMECVKYDRYIKTAFKYRLDRLKGMDRTMDCVFISGDSGSGKTTYAKHVAAGKGYSVFVSSGSNDVLDGYCGEDCIILDDLRPSCMGLSDLLKMLDNNTASTVKSRYKNKVLECRMIIITSVLPLDKFFNNVFEHEDEPIVQLKRRCQTHIIMHTDIMEIYVYNFKTRDYDLLSVYKNPVASLTHVRTHAESEAYVSTVLGSALIGLDKISDDGFISADAAEPLPFD